MPGVSRQMQLRCSFLAMAPVCAWACSSRLDAASGPFSKPIRFIVPYAAAGGTDIVARVYGGNLSKRNPAMPDLPTVAEAGVPGYEVNQWYGVVTSAKTPPGFRRCPVCGNRLVGPGSGARPAFEERRRRCGEQQTRRTQRSHQGRNRQMGLPREERRSGPAIGTRRGSSRVAISVRASWRPGSGRCPNR